MLIYIILCRITYTTNLLINGNFELPAVPANQFITASPTGWSGFNIDLMNYTAYMGYGQAMDLARGISQNGFMEQNVTIPASVQCNLSFYKLAYSNTYFSYVMEVRWNGVLISTETVNSLTVVFTNLTVFSIPGVNNLKFIEVGFSWDSVGMILDEVSLICQPIPTVNYNQNINQKTNIYYSSIPVVPAILLGLACTLPTNHVTFFRYFYLFLEDLWLYHYDEFQHEGELGVALNITAEIELLKSDVLNKPFQLLRYKSAIFISNFTLFTPTRYAEIENSSIILLDTAFSYFIYTIPLVIVTCIALDQIFRILSTRKISSYLRKYFFLKTTIIQTLLEGNIAYFTYVCFGNLNLSFSFYFVDKILIGTTVVFLWVIVLFSLIFYPLIGKYLKKRAGYFIYCVYRFNPGYYFIQIKLLLRNFMRGAIFYFLHSSYVAELFLLLGVEVMVLVITLILQQKQNIFISKSFYSMFLVYHFLFIFHNLSLYFGYLCDSQKSEDLKQLALQFQSGNLYLLISSVLFIMILDFLPLKWEKKKNQVNQDKENTKEKIEIKSRQNQIVPKGKITIKYQKKENFTNRLNHQKLLKMDNIFEEEQTCSIEQNNSTTNGIKRMGDQNFHKNFDRNTVKLKSNKKKSHIRKNIEKQNK